MDVSPDTAEKYQHRINAWLGVLIPATSPSSVASASPAHPALMVRLYGLELSPKNPGQPHHQDELGPNMPQTELPRSRSHSPIEYNIPESQRWEDIQIPPYPTHSLTGWKTKELSNYTAYIRPLLSCYITNLVKKGQEKMWQAPCLGKVSVERPRDTDWEEKRAVMY